MNRPVKSLERFATGHLGALFFNLPQARAGLAPKSGPASRSSPCFPSVEVDLMARLLFLVKLKEENSEI